ncbi:ATP-binding protein [Rariglobus hedericola]|uniref:ATP-binding protein n=1 Tax=Rariglobus hedericola TaxID=2597822 RepID=UPI001396CD48|nr:ATP-binding protein [Rariglobus hedericola]
MPSPKKTTRLRSPARPSERLRAAALDTLGEGVIIADGRWQRGGFRIAFVNTSICTMTGWSAAELRQHPHGFLHTDTRHLTDLRRWRSKASQGRTFTGEGYLTRRDGTRLYTTWTFSLVAGARGAITHVAITYRDMTAKRSLQEALIHSQRLEAVNRLAGGVAHDFNNLLSVINGYCEILGSKPSVRKEATREVGEIHRAGLQAAGLVRQLLAFSRRQTMDPKVVSLNQLVRDNAGIFAKLLGPGKSIALALDATTDHVLVDPSQLQQVLLNLTLNARDALSPGGGVTITTANRLIDSRFHARAGDTPPGRYLQLCVQDNGRGMDEQTQAHLFEPFFTTKEHGQGTGLGLALVYGVVQQSGGYISVRSAAGFGSTFEILLPEVNEPADPQPTSPGPLPSTRGRETILITEADPVVGKMVAGILTTDGYTVLASGSPAKAQLLARRHKKPIHLLIGNLQPADSLKLAKALHSTHPDLRILATDSTPIAPLAWLPREAQATLVKPYALSTLLHTVRALLDGKTARPRSKA